MNGSETMKKLMDIPGQHFFRKSLQNRGSMKLSELRADYFKHVKCLTYPHEKLRSAG